MMMANEDPAPWMPDDGDPGTRRHAPATLRNREPIADILSRVLPSKGLILEIASGSGEHIVYFAKRFPALLWQPSDPDADGRASVTAWAEAESAGNVLPPLDIDARADDWPIAGADAILCINMVHISPWEATLGLLAGASRLLAPGAALYLYGPFERAEIETAPSNIAFDSNLRARNPEWGLRHVEKVVSAAEERGLRLDEAVEMPANNLSLIFRR